MENYLKILGRKFNYKEFDIVIIGDLHGFDKSIKIEKELIKSFKPQFVLHEMLESYNLTKEEAKSIIKAKNWKSKLFNYKSISYIFKLAKETNATFIGSDLKNHGIKNLNDYHVDRELTKQEEEDEEKLIKKRELKQADNIIRFLNKKKKLICITGTYHLRKNSVLVKTLSKLKNLNILLVYPHINGKLFYGQMDFKINELYYMYQLLPAKDL